MKDTAVLTDGEVIAIDGKHLGRSFDKASGKAAIHMVSAWATTNGVVLGQVKVDDKSNEIITIPKLLEVLEIKGCIVTMDVMVPEKNRETNNREECRLRFWTQGQSKRYAGGRGDVP